MMTQAGADRKEEENSSAGSQPREWVISRNSNMRIEYCFQLLLPLISFHCLFHAFGHNRLRHNAIDTDSTGFSTVFLGARVNLG